MKKALTFICLSVLATASFAQKPLNFFVSQDVSYDDNIYLAASSYENQAFKNSGVKKESSIISSTAAGFDYYAGIPDTGLALALNGKAAYNAYTKDSSTNNFTGASAAASLANDIFSVSDSFMYTEDPANSAITDRAKRINNTADFSIKTSADNPIGIGLLANDSLDNYLDDQYKSLSRNKVSGGARLYYNISSKTNVFAEYVYSAISYNESSSDTKESKNNSAALGASGELASTITGSAKVSYDKRSYDKDIVGAETDKSLMGYNVSLTWEPTTQNSITLAGERKLEEADLWLSRYYVSTGVNLTLAQKIFDAFAASVTVGYENMAYPEANPAGKPYAGSKRSDDLVYVRPALDYAFQQWLSAGVWYQYRDRSSNQNDFEYASNKAGAYIKVMF